MSEPALRISDLDRDQAAAVLNLAVADGRLDWTEHSERLAAVYAAKTEVELAPVLRDLQPVARSTASSAPALPALPASSAGPLLVTLSKVRRTPEPNTFQQIQVTLGAAVIDLRGLPQDCTVDLVADSLLGKVEVYLSPGTRLIDSGTAWLGKRSTIEHGRRAPVRPGAPQVRLGGHSVLGHVRVTIG